jgi:hypothetical protein
MKTTAAGVWLCFSFLGLSVGFPESAPLKPQFIYYSVVFANILASMYTYNRLVNGQNNKTGADAKNSVR